MNDSISYRTDKDSISQEKMQFTVLNRRTAYTTEDMKAVKAVIEQQLYTVFCKYA